jgi:osmotically-inducible protein OsmY
MMIAQDTSPQSAPATDNTQINQRDRSPNEPTADKQQNNRSDRDITQQIRKAITSDKSFSEYARNVKVITQNGQVTLKGPVRSDDEKSAIEIKAKAIAGDANVTNDLTVKPKS